MINKISRELFIKSRDGSTVYYLPESSSLRRAIIEVFEEQEDASTNDDYLKDQLNKKKQQSLYTNNFGENKKSTDLYGAAILDYIAQSEVEAREKIILRYANEIRILIQQDEFIDGEVSRSEQYMIEGYEQGQLDFITEALMRVYSSNLGEAHILEGILTMIACVPYEAVSPKGQIMAMGLLTNKILSVRDKAIQCFERWNSKKGLAYLRNVSCYPKWLFWYESLEKWMRSFLSLTRLMFKKFTPIYRQWSFVLKMEPYQLGISIHLMRLEMQYLQLLLHLRISQKWIL